MRKGVRPTKRLLTGLMALLLLLAAAACTPDQDASLEAALQEARAQYRSASLIVRGECTVAHTNAQGEPCYDLKVTDVLAGEYEAGDVIHAAAAMLPGSEYVLYLGIGADAFHTEDQAGYVALADPMLLQGDEIVVGNARIPYALLLEELDQQARIVAAPAKSYFYEELPGLLEHSDLVFLAEVVRVSPAQPRQVRTVDNGVRTQEERLLSFVTVRAYSSAKGALVYGDEVTLVVAQSGIGDLVDGATLTPRPEQANDNLALERGMVGLFFLNRGPDDKQQYYFPVNSAQGFVRLYGDILAPSAQNVALHPYYDLSTFIAQARALLHTQEEEPDSPALVLE